MGTVLSEEDGFCQLGTKAGVLPQKYARNEFMPAPTTFLTPEEVPQKKTTIRTTASTVSPFGGQGFTHCNCTTGCENDRCSCRKNRKVCNSKCHSNRNCKNIDNPPQ
uniref:Metallothionein n=1 Tax=Acrobeloides nanus TaxID=290746 RepID=A0A914BXJ8_9BILA